ncbi:Nicastrin-domain-containing protein [Hyaloraphidium curvatum]|nr:Nicastrin-domain-containing protein [Hyaloraphidium curvatum]
MLGRVADAQEAWLDTLAVQPLVPFPCVMLLNASGTIGCQTFGAAGTLYGIASQGELDAFAKGSGGGFVPVIPFALLSKGNLNTLAQSGRIAGVVVVPGDAPQRFSPDVECPNCRYTQYGNTSWGRYPWNPEGTGLAFETFDYPIFAAWPYSAAANRSLAALQQAVVENAKRGYSSYPLYQVDFDALMYAAGNSALCLSRQFCDPVGGYSVWASTTAQILPQRSIIVVSATLDASAFFHDLAMGISTHISGMVAAMAVADAISRSPTPPSSFNKTILYTFFNAEQWGHAGSQRFVQDITSFVCYATTGTKCPISTAQCKSPCIANLDFQNISMNAVEAFVELNQLAMLRDQVFLYTDREDIANIELLDRFYTAGADQPVKPTNGLSVGRLPPSTAIAFVANRSTLPTAVLADFNGDFSTTYYNSEFDNLATTPVAVEALCSVVTTTSRTVWRMAMGLPKDAPVPPEVAANCTLVAELLDCFGRNFSCPLVRRYLPDINAQYVSSYPSVFNFGSPTAIPFVVNQFMKQQVATALGAACNRTSDCTAANLTGYECVARTCTRSLVRYHQAFGTGLAFDSDSGLFVVTNGSLGTWTESRWTQTALRVFLGTSTGFQVGELVAGIGVAGFSAAACIMGSRYLSSKLVV